MRRVRRTRTVVRSLACRTLTLRTCREGETLLLTGSPRSGTTWMGEVLSFEGDRAMLTEPLHLGLPAAQRAGLEWRTHREAHEAWPQGEALLRRIVRGRGQSPVVFQDNDWPTLLTYRKLLVKSVRANRLLPWIAHRFRLGGIVHLVRHPCAVVSSQMTHPSFGFRGLPDFDRRYVETHLPHLAPRLERLRREEEVRALTWALDQHVPMASPLRDRWLVVPYERMIVDGEAELERVCRGLSLTPTRKARTLLHKSSREAHAWSADHARADMNERLGGWRRRLEPDQVRRILDVVEMVGIVGWSESLVPDVDAMGIAS